MRLILGGLLLMVMTTGWAADSITVKGLFANAALLIIDGEQVLLKKGKSHQGVTLIEATSRDALLEINGQRQRVGLSKQVGGNYQATTSRMVRVARQEGGHHWVRGEINGRSVDFVVDTGASNIAMGASTAKNLGIDYESGERGYVNTANGVSEVRWVTLAKVSVGAITKYNIRAGVSLNDRLPVVLLGNSFLSLVDLRTEEGVLIMEDR